MPEAFADPGSDLRPRLQQQLAVALPLGSATVTVMSSPTVRPVTRKLKKPLGYAKLDDAPVGVATRCKSVNAPLEAVNDTERPLESVVVPELVWDGGSVGVMTMAGCLPPPSSPPEQAASEVRALTVNSLGIGFMDERTPWGF